MSDPFGGEQNEGQERQDDLQLLRAFLFLAERFLAPLRGLAIAQAADFPNHVKIQNRTD